MTQTLMPEITCKNVTRQHHKWFSSHLERNMELLVFGHAGEPVIFFPTRTARFYDYEDWKVIDALSQKIASGNLQVFCVDSIDNESFYSTCCHPSKKISRHQQFENYIILELIPFIQEQNFNNNLITAGCSLGAYHALNIAFRHPHLFTKVVGMSGRYDLTLKLDYFDDLFHGYRNEDIYYHMPTQYIPNLDDASIIAKLKRMEICLAVGRQDAFFNNNIELGRSLYEKNIHHTLHLWEGEAHKAKYWSEMVKIYL